MDWEKVIKNLRDQSNYCVEQANKYSQISGHDELVKEMRASANTASILANAFTAGIPDVGQGSA